ncbi:hypothetical protein NQ176_g6970 [Zarea fungicola]|uniref:Uncharacterized protein n=1 Tax=Zarea fungicola TaxID=93591 RepID=A0ACC1N0H9_9HYPO|nr:hypothetical protein NQ176_g6970 [Lecanicillium fungicola]
MASNGEALLKLFTSGSEIRQTEFHSSVSLAPSPPRVKLPLSVSSPLYLADPDSEVKTSAGSKLNPESAVWTPPGWGDLSPAATKQASATTVESDFSSPSTSFASQDDVLHDYLTHNGTPAKGHGNERPSAGCAVASPLARQQQRSRGVQGISPAVPAAGYMTEPRNYAPRTSGKPMSSEPPPKFILSIGAPSQDQPLELLSPQQFDEQVGALVQQTLPQQPTSLVAYQPPAAAAQQDTRSEKLKALTSPAWEGLTLANILDPSNMPFTETAKLAKAQNRGVLRLSNIPFATKRSEVIAFLGRNSKILNDSEEPVHIIMERVTSKTMDAYVEFMTLEDAMRAVEKHNLNQLAGRPCRLGDRPVELSLSSQASLMKDLFPIAAGVFWKGSTPEIQPFNPKEPWSNFKGFISEEEMIMLVKHVEMPQRSPFSKECPQRPYECLISTLRKFPWYMTDCITLKQRGAVFQATCELLRLLKRSLDKGDDPINLNKQLFRRVTKAAMECPGFTPLMKDDVAWLTNMSDAEQRSHGQPRFANSWRHQYALSPKPGMPLDVVEWYINTIRDQTMQDIFVSSPTERRTIQEKAQETDGYWGYFWAIVNYPTGPAFDNMTLAYAAHVEFAAIEAVLARAFTRM